MQRFLVILPAYNEATLIASVIQGLRESEKNADILVINDGSKDRTAEIAEQQGVMVINHPYNLGYAAALQTGFRYASSKQYDCLVTMDADGQHDPVSISNLFKTFSSTNADVVTGSRFLEGSYRMGCVRRIGVRIFSSIARLYTGNRLTDPTSGFQLFNRKSFTFLAAEDGYPLDYPDVNIIMLLHKRKFKVVEAPVRMFTNTEGRTMHGGMKPVMYVTRMLLAIILVLLRRGD
jgi:glycosyltransferase involved in cell wall biosynthesis